MKASVHLNQIELEMKKYAWTYSNVMSTNYTSWDFISLNIKFHNNCKCATSSDGHDWQIMEIWVTEAYGSNALD